LPFDNPIGGNAKGQAQDFEALKGWTGPIHFIWGGSDAVFTEDWGRAWARHYPQASFDSLPGAGHFLQETRGDEIAQIFLRRAPEA
jgi:haloalkane dehalogenase